MERMKPKRRLSASVDADLMAAAAAATRRGQAPTVSAWVNDALRLKVEHDQRLRALAAFVDAYEGEHGEITPEEIESATRRASSRAVVVRSVTPLPVPGARRRRGVR
jgi:hypothetical protein